MLSAGTVIRDEYADGLREVEVEPTHLGPVLDAGVARVGPGGQRELLVEADDRETGGHEATDYPWPRA